MNRNGTCGTGTDGGQKMEKINESAKFVRNK